MEIYIESRIRIIGTQISGIIKIGVFFFALISTNMYAQTIAEASNINEDTLVYAVAEVMPEYTEGREAMYKFIASNVRYPVEARRYGHEGTVYVGFVVTKNGTMRDVEIVKGVTEALNNEAVRVVGLLSSWKPGMQSGKPVNVKFVLPVKFKLAADKKYTTPDSLIHLIKSDFASDTVYDKVDSMPHYPRGMKAFYKLIGQHMIYPFDAIGMEGTVYIGFVVTKNGELKSIRTLQGVIAPLDTEAQRAVEFLGSTPWVPGKLNGTPVNVKYVLPIKFKLGSLFDLGTLTLGDTLVVKKKLIRDVVPPQPKWGLEDVYRTFEKKMKYPEEARKAGIEGDVYVEFVINRDGRISDTKTIRSVSPELDAEAERIIGLMHPWIAARVNGKSVRVRHVLGVRFKL